MSFDFNAQQKEFANHRREHTSTVPTERLLEVLARACARQSTMIFVMVSEADGVRGYWVNAQDAQQVFALPQYAQAELLSQ